MRKVQPRLKGLLVYLIIPLGIGSGVFSLMPSFSENLMHFLIQDGGDYFFNTEEYNGPFFRYARSASGVMFLYLMTVVIWGATNNRIKYGLFNYSMAAIVLIIRIIQVRMEIVNRNGPEDSVSWYYDNLHNLIWQVILVLLLFNLALAIRKKYRPGPIKT